MLLIIGRRVYSDSYFEIKAENYYANTTFPVRPVPLICECQMGGPAAIHPSLVLCVTTKTKPEVVVNVFDYW